MPPRKRKADPLPPALAAHVDATLAKLSEELPEGARLELDDTPPEGFLRAREQQQILTEEPPPVIVTPPTPSSYRAAWWPTQVRLPDGTVIPQAKVFATRVGLYIYTGRPDGDRPDYYFPIDYSKTAKPPADYALRQKAIRITTPYGEVRIHKLSGCGCNHPLKHWKPAWAGRIEPWSA